ncbi:MAG: TrkH family potassium uptake protein [Pseudomonadales bacterium]|nr:TrkH family potassium uptake protein [Pseudomonadales bacterium]
MHLGITLRIIGVLLTVYSVTMLPPAVVALIYQDGGEVPFFTAFALILAVGLLCWLTMYKHKQELRVRDGFIIVVVLWSVWSLSGSIPYILSEDPNMSVTDAIFESVSGLTTTGATVLSGLDDLPKSILFYRQQQQWLGGMGIIVLAVAVLPMLGIGGMQLYRAEAPGPVKDNKLTPRITETAKALWYIYVTLTVVCGFSYWLAGMDVFDAICHSFSTVAIGGFSTHDSSIAFFDNPLIEMICVFFMFFAGVNFALHFVSWRNRSVMHYLSDAEFVFYFKVMCAITLITILTLLLNNTYDSAFEAIRYGVFEAVSISTTTGFATANYAAWPNLVPALLLMGSFIGGCAGSTGGGVKVIRALLMSKQWMREMHRLIHPNAVFAIKVGNKPVNDRVVEAVWGFIGAYISIFAALLLAIMATGLDFETSFSAIAASINNLGPGLGAVAAHYADINDIAKWILCLAMLLGRLEVFTLLVLFSPMFWRR